MMRTTIPPQATLVARIRGHPILAYFIATYVISWGGAFLVVAPELVRGQAVPQMSGLLMFPVLLLGPSIAGFTLTAIVEGRRGMRSLLARMVRWRVSGGWYLALLIPPVAVLAVLLILRTGLSPAFSPHFFPLGILFGLVPGFVEEIGWSGYVFPKMQMRYGPCRGSLLLGVLWGLWHLPVIDYLGAAYPHGAYWLPYALAFIVAMTAMRVLIAWVYTNTTSVLLAQLLHVSSTASLVVLGPSPISPAQEALWYAVYALVLWGIVAVVLAIYGNQLVRQPVPVGHPKEARAWRR